MKKLLSIILAVTCLCICFGKAGAATPVGLMLDEMDTEDLYGNQVTGEIFSQYNLTFLNFWATWCGPCLNELPHIQAMYEDEGFKERGLNVMGLLWEDSSSTVKNAKKTLEAKGCTYTNIRIGNDAQLRKLVNNSGDGIPVSYLIDNTGKVIKYIVGSMSKNQMKNFINQGFAMIETQPTPTPTTEPTPTPTPAVLPIEKAEVTGVKTIPHAGDRVVEYLTYKVADDAPFVVMDIIWGDVDAQDELDSEYVFEEGRTYQLAILLCAKTGYEFTEDTVVTLNGGIEISQDSGIAAEGTNYWIITLPTEAQESEAVMTGDVNGDGSINTADAVLVLKNAAGMTTLDDRQTEAADTNRDGTVNTGDAVLVLKYAAGIITEF